MAKRQTRRSVSLNRDVYVAASKAALRADKTLSQFVTDCMRACGVDIEETVHVPVEIAERASVAIRHSIVAREEKRAERARVGVVRQPRVVESFLRVRRDGPIRRLLGDGKANALGEPHWYERKPLHVKRKDCA